MVRRRTKRSSLLSVIILEVGSLLGIVALAQPSALEYFTAQAASAGNRPGHEAQPQFHTQPATAYQPWGPVSDPVNAGDAATGGSWTLPPDGPLRTADTRWPSSGSLDTRWPDTRWMVPARGGFDSKFNSTAYNTSAYNTSAEGAWELVPRAPQVSFDAYR